MVKAVKPIIHFPLFPNAGQVYIISFKNQVCMQLFEIPSLYCFLVLDSF